MSVILGLLLGVLLAAVGAAAGDGQFEGAEVLKVAVDSEGLLQGIIEKYNLDVWTRSKTHLDVLVPEHLLDPVKQFLGNHNIDFAAMIPDLEEAIRAEKKVPRVTRTISSSATGTNNSSGYAMNWDQYQRLSTILDFLDTLAKLYPSFVSVGVMGRSYEDRPLKYIKISSGNPNATSVFIDGGIHAREWAAPAAVTYIIRELVERRASLPREIQGVDFYILPVINPDGYEFTHTTNRMWRKNRSPAGQNCTGADINRNFDFKFGGEGTSGNNCSEIYRGKGPASELETKAFVSFIQSLGGSLKAYVTFHSYGQYILIPYGYKRDQLAPDFAEMKAVGDAAAEAIKNATAAKYTVGNTANTLYPAAGGSDDWVKAKLPSVKYVYTIELRETEGEGFLLPARQIVLAGREAWEAVKVIATAAFAA